MSLPAKHFYEFGRFRVDVQERLLLCDGVAVQLPPKTFDLLLVLVEGSGRVLPKEELMKRMWPDSFVEEANLSHHVFTLRKALGEVNDGKLIETIPRRGYRFVANVSEITDEGVDILIAERSRAHIVVDEESEISEVATLAAAPKSVLTKSTPSTDAVQASPKWFESKRLMIVAGVIAVLGLVVAALLVVSRQNRSAAVPPMQTVPFMTSQGFKAQPRVSPDGKSIAFTWDGVDGKALDIYVQLIGAGDPLRLTNNEADDDTPVWSPDGRFIAFLRRTDDKTDVFTVPALGGAERKLITLVSSFTLGIDWSPDGKYLVFPDQETASGKTYSIYLLSLDTLEKRRLTSPSDDSFGDVRPVFSPDGQSVAFVRIHRQGSELEVVKTSGSEPKLVTTNSSGIASVSWMPDGEKLVYSAGSATQTFYGLWRVRSAGGTPEVVMMLGEGVKDICVARVGDRLAYSQAFVDTNIWQMDVPPTPERPVTPVKLVSSSVTDEFAVFSPNGKKIAFNSNRSGHHELWLCDSNGANPVQLSSFSGPMTGNPLWSPDGQQIAFHSIWQEHLHVYLLNIETRVVRRFTDGTAENLANGWSFDGKWIYFDSDRTGGREIWKAPVDGGEPVRVTRAGGYKASESPDGKFIYYSKLSKPGLWRLPIEGGDEVAILENNLAPEARWVMSREGIYFVDRKASPEAALEFYSFATQQVSRVLMQKDLRQCLMISVSPDAKSVIYDRADYRRNDIMLIENFR